MFERIVAEDEDEDRPRRYLLSLTFTTWASSAALCAFGSTIWSSPMPPVPERELTVAWLEIGSDMERDPLPALPRLPDPPRPARGLPREPQPPLPEPEPSHAEVSEVSEVPGWSIACCSGDCCGEDCPQYAPEPPLPRAGVRLAPVEPLRRVAPEYPRAARALHLGEQRCTAEVSIDGRGQPTDVSVSGCPRVFHAATRAALLRWRWSPPGSEEAMVRVGISYR